MTAVLEAPAASDTAKRGTARLSRDRLGYFAAIVVAGAAATVVTSRMAGAFVDDSYITMRFARNLAAGDGWTYNVGEQTANGATSPAFTLALAALSIPVRAVERASNLLFVLSFGAIAGFLAATFGRREGVWVGLTTVAALIACPVVMGMKGMESLPFLALVCAALWAARSGRDAALGVACALLVLTRGEGVLLVGVLLCQLWVTRRRIPLRVLAFAALTALPWVAYSVVAFHTVLPDTLAAKIAQSRSGYFGEGRVFLRGFFDLAEPMRYSGWLWVVTPVAGLGLVRSCVDRSLRLLVLPLVGATLLHVVAYGLVLSVPGYHWYYAWEFFTLAVLAAVAVAWAIERLVALAERRGLQSVAVAGAAVVLTVCAVGAASRVHVSERSSVHYVEMGHWLADNTPSDARIALTEIGTVGWFSDRPIVDYLGLLSIDSTEELADGDLRSWLEREEPDYWVVHAPLWPFEAPAANQPWFNTAYEQVFVSDPIPDSGGQVLVVYEKVMSIRAAKAQSG